MGIVCLITFARVGVYATQLKTSEASMGGSWSKKILSFLYKNKEIRILMLGLDAAGKTTILYSLRLGEVVTTIPTIGFNLETVKHKGVDFVTWDVSGRNGIRPLWRHYYHNTGALVFVVDSSDRDRIGECCEEVQRLAGEEELKDSVLLVFANKQDIEGAMSVEEVTNQLNLDSIAHIPWHVQGCCGTTQAGLHDGLDWLHSQLTHKSLRDTTSAPVKESIAPISSRLYTYITSYLSPRDPNPDTNNATA